MILTDDSTDQIIITAGKERIMADKLREALNKWRLAHCYGDWGQTAATLRNAGRCALADVCDIMAAEEAAAAAGRCIDPTCHVLRAGGIPYMHSHPQQKETAAVQQNEHKCSDADPAPCKACRIKQMVTSAPIIFGRENLRPLPSLDAHQRAIGLRHVRYVSGPEWSDYD